MSHEIRQQVTDRILKALGDGLIPWGRPWLAHRNDGPPTNALTTLPFRGVNSLLLNLAGFHSKWWATKRCWTAFGFRVRRHQHGVQVFTGKGNDLQGQAMLNAEQVKGPGVERYLVGDSTGKRLPDYEAADRVIASTAADIRNVNSTKALYYRLPEDYIVLPLKAQFMEGPCGLPAFYNTAFHELAHWSEHRLDWLADPHLPVKERYAIGEIRSEMGAAFLSGRIGLPHPEGMRMNHDQFVHTWMRLMQTDNTFIFRVSDVAWQASEFILSFSRPRRGSSQAIA